MFDTKTDPKQKKAETQETTQQAGGVDQQTANHIAMHTVAKILAAHANDSTDPKDVGPSFFLPDFDALAERRAIQTEVMAALTTKYGVEPKAQSGLFDSPDAKHEAGLEAFRLALRKAVLSINAGLAKQHSNIRVTEAEIATNCLAEGSILYVWGTNMKHATRDPAGKTNEPTMESGVSFFMASGVLDMETQMKDKRVSELLPEGYIPDDPNDRFGSALIANATIYTAMIPQLIEDLAAVGTKWTDLPPEGQFYWKTVYFNRGRPRGRQFLHNQAVDGDLPGEQNTKGVLAYKTPLGAADGELNKGNAKFNAAWRTATYELLTKATAVDGAEHDEGQQLLPMMRVSFIEGLELAQAMSAEVIGATGDAFDDRRAQDFLLLARELEKWQLRRSKSTDWAPATWSRVQKEMPRVSADRKKVEGLLASRHGARGKQWSAKGPDVVKFYAQYAAKLNREMPRIDLMTDEQFRIEWVNVNGALNGFLDAERHPGYIAMKSWMDAIVK